MGSIRALCFEYNCNRRHPVFHYPVAGNIAMAMGIHFAVNIFAILIIGQVDTPIGSGAALWLSTIAPKSAILGLSMIFITVVEIVLYSIWARRRYGALIPTEVR